MADKFKVADLARIALDGTNEVCLRQVSNPDHLTCR